MTGQKNNTLSLKTGSSGATKKATGFARHEADYDELAAVYRAERDSAELGSLSCRDPESAHGEQGFRFSSLRCRLCQGLHRIFRENLGFNHH